MIEVDELGEEKAEMIEFKREVERRKLLAVREMELQSREMLEVQVLEERLEEWMLGCQRCRAAGKVGKECEGYSIWECCKERADIIRDEVKRIKGLIKWERFSCCFECGIPQR
jgi:hypothetical protein